MFTYQGIPGNGSRLININRIGETIGFLWRLPLTGVVVVEGSWTTRIGRAINQKPNIVSRNVIYSFVSFCSTDKWCGWERKRAVYSHWPPGLVHSPRPEDQTVTRFVGVVASKTEKLSLPSAVCGRMEGGTDGEVKQNEFFRGPFPF